MIPQITASIGPSAGGSVYSPAMTDFVIMVEKAGTMFVTGPDVVKTVLGEEISFEDLGWSNDPWNKKWCCTFCCTKRIRLYGLHQKVTFVYVPQNNAEEPPIKVKTDDDPNRLDHNLINIIPENPLTALRYERN